MITRTIGLPDGRRFWINENRTRPFAGLFFDVFERIVDSSRLPTYEFRQAIEKPTLDEAETEVRLLAGQGVL